MPVLPSLPASPLTASVDTTTNVSQISVHTGTNWPAGIVQGQTITNAGIPSCGIPSNTTIIDVNTTNAVLSNEIGTGATNCAVNIQGAYTLFRLVGALYAVSGPAIPDFTQVDDTFYLKTSVKDIPATGGGCAGSITSTAASCQLSVPCGRNASCLTPIAVEAFGRIASAGSSAQIFASSLDQTDQGPNIFGNAPANTSTSSNTTDAYPFRIYTSAAVGMTTGAIRLRSTSGTGATVNEVTDGWVWHRGK